MMNWVHSYLWCTARSSIATNIGRSRESVLLYIGVLILELRGGELVEYVSIELLKEFYLLCLCV